MMFHMKHKKNTVIIFIIIFYNYQLTITYYNM